MEGKLYGVQTKGCEVRPEKPRGVLLGERKEPIFKRKDLFNSGECEIVFIFALMLLSSVIFLILIIDLCFLYYCPSK